MKIRKQTYGNKNLVGKNIERLRKEKGIKQKDFIAQIQVMGCDMNPTSYSKLEGQIRSATDKEIYIIAKILGVAIEELFNNEKQHLIMINQVLFYCLQFKSGSKPPDIYPFVSNLIFAKSPQTIEKSEQFRCMSFKLNFAHSCKAKLLLRNS